MPTWTRSWSSCARSLYFYYGVQPNFKTLDQLFKCALDGKRKNPGYLLTRNARFPHKKYTGVRAQRFDFARIKFIVNVALQIPQRVINLISSLQVFVSYQTETTVLFFYSSFFFSLFQNATTRRISFSYSVFVQRIKHAMNGRCWERREYTPILIKHRWVMDFWNLHFIFSSSRNWFFEENLIQSLKPKNIYDVDFSKRLMRKLRLHTAYIYTHINRWQFYTINTNKTWKVAPVSN